jgi:hypothetical protein
MTSSTLERLAMLAHGVEEERAEVDFPEYLREILPNPWPYQMERARAWEERSDEVILKARQIGVTELAAAYAAYRAENGMAVLVLSKGLRESRAFLRRARDVLLMRGALGETDNADSLITGAGGEIMALPATRDAGRSFTAGLVIVDEAAFHPWAAYNYAAYRPAMADGGQLLIVSTANGSSGWYHEMWKAAPGNGLKPVFLSWRERPSRGDAWLQKERAAYEGIQAEFAQEYPESPEEAFIAHSGLVYGMDEDGVSIFQRQRNVRSAPCEWGEYKWRLAGVDPGGRDPTAVGLIGVTKDDRVHFHALLHRKTPTGLDEIGDYLLRWNKDAPFTREGITVDPSSRVTAETLYKLSLPAKPANNDKGARIMFLRTLLKSGRLTIDPSIPQVVTEMESYYFAEPSEHGQSNTWATVTAGKHHADSLDALGYAVMEIPRLLGQRRAGKMEGHRMKREYMKDMRR